MIQKQYQFEPTFSMKKFRYIVDLVDEDELNKSDLMFNRTILEEICKYGLDGLFEALIFSDNYHDNKAKVMESTWLRQNNGYRNDEKLGIIQYVVNFLYYPVSQYFCKLA